MTVRSRRKFASTLLGACEVRVTVPRARQFDTRARQFDSLTSLHLRAELRGTQAWWC